MNWLDIFCFTSAAKTGSFSMAAKELMISQQAVSRHIRKLEDELGFPLFLRNYQNVYLTKAGELMLSCFQDRDEILNHYRESIPNTSKHAPLRIAWSQWLGCPSSFKRILDGFITQHSDIPVFIYSLPPSELLSMMENHELDFVLMTRYELNHQPVVWKNLILGEEPIYLFGDSRLSYDPNSVALHPQIAAFAGESSEEDVRSRVSGLCAKLGYYSVRTEVYPNMRSVCMNVSIRKAMAFGTGNSTCFQNDHFCFFPTEASATVILCRPFDITNPAIPVFEDFAAHSKEVSL